MNSNEFTPDVLVAIVAAIVTVISFYVPKFVGLDSNKKQLVQLGLMAVVTAVAYGLSCTDYFNFLSCDTAGIFKALELFAVSVVSQVATYGSTKYIFERKVK